MINLREECNACCLFCVLAFVADASCRKGRGNIGKLGGGGLVVPVVIAAASDTTKVPVHSIQAETVCTVACETNGIVVHASAVAEMTVGPEPRIDLCRDQSQAVSLFSGRSGGGEGSTTCLNIPRKYIK